MAWAAAAARTMYAAAAAAAAANELDPVRPAAAALSSAKKCQSAHDVRVSFYPRPRYKAVSPITIEIIVRAWIGRL